MTLGETLERLGAVSSDEIRDGYLRFGIPTANALGVGMADIRRLAKQIGRDHELASVLWKGGVYEARLLAILADETSSVDCAQVDRWAAEFDNWAICDTACSARFCRTPHA